MNILIVSNLHIPCLTYGGIERVIWWLGKALNESGHSVTYLVKESSTCPFAHIIPFDPNKLIDEQIPDTIDVVHIHFPTEQKITKRPYLFTAHAITEKGQEFDENYVFISKEHARLNNSDVYVYHGLDIDDYGKPDLNNKRDYFHFLGKAKTPHKNLKGAIQVTRLAHERLNVIGGKRLFLRLPPRFRFTLDRHVQFSGMIGGAQKNAVINGSKGLIHPMRSFESFGLALIESLYFGCPVFATSYGAIKELIPKEVGALANNAHELSELVRQAENYNRQQCYEYVCDQFLAKHMAQNYLKLYEKVISGVPLNPHKPKSISYSDPLLPWG